MCFLTQVLPLYSHVSPNPYPDVLLPPCKTTTSRWLSYAIAAIVRHGGAGLILFSDQFDLLLRVGVSGLPGAGNGTASVKIDIPNDPKLKGSKAYFQWGVADPAAKGSGLAFSAAARLLLL